MINRFPRVPEQSWRSVRRGAMGTEALLGLGAKRRGGTDHVRHGRQQKGGRCAPKTGKGAARVRTVLT